MKIKPVVSREGADVSVEWLVDAQQSSLVFGKVVVQGSSTFPFECIMREVSHKQGDGWSQDALKRSQMRLKSLNVFDHIYLRPMHDADGNQRDVLLKLRMDDPFEVRLRGGIGLQQIAREFNFAGVTYKAGGTFLVKNPSNVGDQLGLDADFTRGFRKLALHYNRPWVGPIPAHMIAKVYTNKYQQPGFVGSKKNLYSVKQQGWLLGLHHEHQLCDTVVNVGMEWMETAIRRDDPDIPNLEQRIARAINFSSSLLDKKIPYAFFEPTMFIDLVDNRLNPTKGMLTLLSAKGMVPFFGKHTDAYFIKLLLEHSIFVPLGSVVLGVRMRAGHIFHQEFNHIMPNERFYLGGANSLRGYETDLAPPLGCYVDEDDKVRYVPQGGKSMINANLELRFPLYKDVGAVIFQDVGALSSGKFSTFKKETMLASTGFGLRYNTPIGPLRFDIGWKWHSDPTDTSYAWFVTVGHAF